MKPTLPRLSRDAMPFIPSVGLAFVAALLEALVLASLLPLIEAAASDRGDLELPFGPIRIGLDTMALAQVVVVAIVMMTLLHIGSSWLRARAHTGHLDASRRRLMKAWASADADVTHVELPGRLMELLGFVSQRALALTSLASLAGAVGSMLVFVVTALVVDPAAAGAIVVVGGLLAAALIPVRRRQQRLSRERAALNVELTEAVGQLVDNLDDIGRHGVAEHVLGTFHDRDRHALSLIRRTRAMLGSVGPLYRGVGMLVVIGAVLVSSRATNVDTTTFGAAAILLYRSLAVGQRIQTDLTSIADASGAIEQLDAALATYDRSVTTWGTDEIDTVDTIELDGVTYRYPGSDDAALHEISLRLAGGDMIGIAGPSGSGKSTLASLLGGRREPTHGEVRLNGKPRSAYTEAAWTSAIAMVPQTTRIIEATVADNIAYHRSGVDRDTVIRAAKAAGVHEQIVALPDGYETRIGPSTRALSGGQVQRLGIARALAGGPNVIILDEPTSALDDASEAIVADTLDRLRGSVLAVVIAHRPRTLDVCDRVVLMGDGVVIDDHRVRSRARPRPEIARPTTAEGPVIDLGDEPRSPGDAMYRSG